MKINDWQQAETALAAIAKAQAEIDSATISAEAEIAATRAGLKKLCAPRADKIGELAGALEEFVGAHKAEILPSKSKELTSGVVGFRLSKPGLRYPKDSDGLLAKLRALKLEAYIRPKFEVNKDLLVAHRERLPLADLGLKEKKQRDEFYYELKSETPPEA